MTFQIDQEKCIGCGACTGQCPAVFKMNEAINKAEVVKDAKDGCDESVKDICPVQAISFQ